MEQKDLNKTSINDVRLQQIDEEVERFKQNLEDMSGLFKDESQMRKIIYEQLYPIVAIAKENMLTNCRKNQEIKYAQDDLKEVHSMIYEFTHKLDKLNTFEDRINHFEERINKEMVKVRKDFAQREVKNNLLSEKIKKFEEQTRNVSHELKIKDMKYQ